MLAVPAALGLLVVTVGCGDDRGGAATDEGRMAGSITVSAASSLAEPFDRLGAAFEDDHPEVEVTFTYDSSSALAAQIEAGAPADVFASAAEDDMAPLSAAGLVEGRATVFARNRLVVVTKPGNPTGISSPADLATAEVVSLCAAEAPCGRYAQQVLDATGVTVLESSVTRGQNSGATLTAVSEGDAVAGIVYRTDAARAGDAVDTVEIPAANVVADYPIAALRSSESPEVAAAFVELVLSAEGQRTLREHGFLPPA